MKTEELIKLLDEAAERMPQFKEKSLYALAARMIEEQQKALHKAGLEFTSFGFAVVDKNNHFADSALSSEEAAIRKPFRTVQLYVKAGDAGNEALN